MASSSGWAIKRHIRLLLRIGNVDLVVDAVYIHRAAMRTGRRAAVVRKVVSAILAVVVEGVEQEEAGAA
jgi:hypothetical protein